ncbi:unnamed protein product, partial [Prunus brigantina]
MCGCFKHMDQQLPMLCLHVWLLQAHGSTAAHALPPCVAALNTWFVCESGSVFDMLR